MSGASTGTSSPARVRRLRRATGRVRGDRSDARPSDVRLGVGTEIGTVSGFFLMGIGATSEHAFRGMTGHRVGEFWGWTLDARLGLGACP